MGQPRQLSIAPGLTLVTDEAVEPGTLFVVGPCSCMTDETMPPREECERCLGSGITAAKMTNVASR